MRRLPRFLDSPVRRGLTFAGILLAAFLVSVVERLVDAML